MPIVSQRHWCLVPSPASIETVCVNLRTKAPCPRSVSSAFYIKPRYFWNRTNRVEATSLRSNARHSVTDRNCFYSFDERKTIPKRIGRSTWIAFSTIHHSLQELLVLYRHPGTSACLLFTSSPISALIYHQQSWTRKPTITGPTLAPVSVTKPITIPNTSITTIPTTPFSPCVVPTTTRQQN